VTCDGKSAGSDLAGDVQASNYLLLRNTVVLGHFGVRVGGRASGA